MSNLVAVTIDPATAAILDVLSHITGHDEADILDVAVREYAARRGLAMPAQVD